MARSDREVILRSMAVYFTEEEKKDRGYYGEQLWENSKDIL